MQLSTSGGQLHWAPAHLRQRSPDHVAVFHRTLAPNHPRCGLTDIRRGRPSCGSAGRSRRGPARVAGRQSRHGRPGARLRDRGDLCTGRSTLRAGRGRPCDDRRHRIAAMEASVAQARLRRAWTHARLAAAVQAGGKGRSRMTRAGGHARMESPGFTCPSTHLEHRA